MTPDRLTALRAALSDSWLRMLRNAFAVPANAPDIPHDSCEAIREHLLAALAPVLADEAGDVWARRWRALVREAVQDGIDNFDTTLSERMSRIEREHPHPADAHAAPPIPSGETETP